MLDAERKILLKADDRGNEMGVMRGIDDLVERGLITDVSLIIQFTKERERDLLLEAIEKSSIKDEPGIGILLHVNTVTGKPVSDPDKVSSLVNSQGVFRRPAQTTRSSWEEYAQTIKMDDVRTELEAQITQFHQVFAHYPHALDAHNMGLWFPYEAAEITMQLAEQLKIPLTAPKVFTNQSTSGPFNDVFIVDQRIRDEIKRRGIPTPDHASVTYWNSSDTLIESTSRLLRALGSLKPGVTEFFFHPGHPDFESSDPRYKRGRVRDYQLLTDPLIQQRISSLPLTSYRQILTEYNSQRLID